MTAGPVSNTQAMIAAMAPVLDDGCFAFVTIRPGEPDDALRSRAIASIREREGLSLVLTLEDAQAAGFAGPAMRMITLSVHSALEGVGLTAAVSGALAQAGIACNIVAGFHHDHVFVPEGEAERALSVLTELQRRTARS